jgi:hypothetical protein
VDAPDFNRQPPKGHKTIGRFRSGIEMFVENLCLRGELFAQTVYLNRENHQSIVNLLEKNEKQESLVGVEGVWFISGAGQDFLFLNQNGKTIDCPETDQE